MIPESSIEPVDMESLRDVEVSDEDAAEAIAKTVVIKLNGGLGTIEGLDRAKSLLCRAPRLSFLDIIARQVLHLRKQYDVTLPLIFMNSFRTSADTMAALARYGDLPVEGLPLEFLQNKVPEAAGQGPAAGQPGPGPSLGGVRPGTATSTPRCAAPACWTGCSRSATSGSSCRTPTTSARSRAGSPAGSPPPVRRSRSRPCGVPLGPQGRPLRAPQERRPAGAPGDRADAARRPGGAGRPRAAPVLLDQQPGSTSRR